MVGILKLLLSIFCVTFAIYTIKNYNYMKKKVKESPICEGLLVGVYLILAIIILSYSILYIIYSLNYFGIIDAEQIFSQNEKVIDDGVRE